jgi:8-oxo-dGTP pyrophosphatase MutT (NUDIX family)
MRFFSPSELRRMRGRDQVAAICYRIRDRKIDFLLVQTRGGRWTFPKGSAEPGLTNAQSAALEAFEEAGVHGRMEEAPFARYVHRKRRSAKSGGGEMLISAHLCEVLWLEPPQESNRNPSWFAVEKAKRKLADGRSAAEGAEFVRIVESAVTRIQQQRNRFPVTIDALQKVYLSARRAVIRVAKGKPFLLPKAPRSS